MRLPPLSGSNRHMLKDDRCFVAFAYALLPLSSCTRALSPRCCCSERSPSVGPEWLYEIKLDGYRALGIKSGGKVQLRSRNDNDFSSRYSGIARALMAMPDETVIDGEVVALDEEGRPSFNLLQTYGSARTQLVYYVFDLLILAGRD